MNSQLLGDKTVQQITVNNTERKYDIIVFGASGFTGQFVVLEMANFSQTYNLTWAIAGRNTCKLQKMLDDMYKSKGKLFCINYSYLFYPTLFG